MLKERLNREFFTRNMISFFKNDESCYADDVWQDDKGVLWLGYYNRKDFIWVKLVNCFTDNPNYVSYSGKYSIKTGMLEKVTDYFVQKFNSVGSCAWDSHTYENRGKTRRQCIRCGKTQVRKTEVIKRKVWVDVSQEDSK